MTIVFDFFSMGLARPDPAGIQPSIDKDDLTRQIPSLTRIFHILGGPCHTLNGRAALPRRPESGRSSSFALPDQKIRGLE
jgi:hypothetical protein